ncbi:MAG: hypothetical protein R3E10_07420 [Gemmatimonadota bacterium]
MSIVRAVLRWYFLELATVLAVLAVFLGSPLERLLWIGVALLGGVALVHKHGGERAGARALKAVLGLAALALALFGVALLVFGVVLVRAGSFGILAGMVLVPMGLSVAGLGWSAFKMATTKIDHSGFSTRLNHLFRRA